MKTREEHLAWCKERALAELRFMGPDAAVTRMMEGLRAWGGGDMYQPTTVVHLEIFGRTEARLGSEATRRWIEGFN